MKQSEIKQKNALKELKEILEFSRENYPLHISDWKQAFKIIEILIEDRYLKKKSQ